MATEAVLHYLSQLYYQPSLNNVANYIKWNTSRAENTTLLPAYEGTELANFQDELSELPVSAAHFGLATGLLAILLNSRLVSFKVLKTDARVSECQRWAEAFLPRLLLGLLCLLLTASLAPLVAIGFLFLAVYRHVVRLLLRLNNPMFADLLEGTDAVWALEDDTSKSIINVLAFFEVEIIDNVFNPQLLGMLRRLMRERVLSSPDACPKFWQHRRRSRLGYFYWERQQEVQVEDHVQFMTQEDDIVNLEAPDLSEDCFRQDYYGMSESVLKGLVSELANSPLPYDNAASWEILVGRDPILEDFSDTDPFQAMEEGNPEATGRFRRYPVLFRVHHSMGDGVALVKLLLETLADKPEPTDPLRGITTTRILGYDNEETTRLTRRKTFSRFDSIDLIKCSIGSSAQDNPTGNNKVKRPTFIDLSPASLEKSKKKLFTDFLAEDAVSEKVEIFVDKSPNIVYSKLPSKFPKDHTTDDIEEELELSRIIDGMENDKQNIFCYQAKETILTMDESVKSANDVILNHSNMRTVYFDRKTDYKLDDAYVKVVEYRPSENKLELFKDESPPPRRCKSPMPPFKRDVSRIERVMDEILETRSRPCTPFTKDDSLSSCSESSVAITLDDPETNVMDVLPPLPRVRSPYPGYEAMTVSRNESPAPKLHRKKYPVRFQDEDSEDSPPTPRKDTSRPQSPFLRDYSPLSHPGKKGACKPNWEETSRTGTPISWYNSSASNVPAGRAGSPFQISGIFDQGKEMLHRNHQYTPAKHQCGTNENSSSRCSLPFIMSTVAQAHNDNQTPRCQSPFTRNGTPLPRNDNPISRCNSPFRRNGSPMPRNDNPIPRCNSPFSRNNTPIPRIDTDIPKCTNIALKLKHKESSRPSSPFKHNASPTKKKTSIKQLYLTNSCFNPRVNEVLNQPQCKLIEEDTTFKCPFVELTDGVDIKATTTETDKKNETMQNVPLMIHSAPAYTEKFIRGQFFSNDGEVINRTAAAPNCFIKLLDSINHRPSAIEHVCNYVKNTCALAFAPASLIHQTMVKAADVNPLHGPHLSGEKVVSWYFDSNAVDTDNIFNTIKRIKTRMLDSKFTDVLLSALSASLESFFLRSGCDSTCIPDSVSVVIPVRMATQKEIAEAMELRAQAIHQTESNSIATEKINENDAPPKIPPMENKFSVALLSLPITSVSTDSKLAKPFSPISRLREICKHTDILRKSPDYYINYWLMRVVSKYLPLQLLAPLLNSTQSTMVVSNLMGPPMQLKLGGYHLKDIVFWVPNRGSTGVGVSVLSYAGRLQIGIVADRALIPCQQDASIIVEGIISELKYLDEITAPIKTQPLKV